ncbi:glycosyltransferase [Candidatus Dojkabacteria bacterium]|nr:glycosyltransferase [Candidatus Dojkabacteria bacterium]
MGNLKSKLKISIITPVYNMVPFIEDTVKSVLSQNGDFVLEYIVMDAKSTDGTLEILERYSDKIVLVSEKDSGQADAINKGLKLASGDVVAFLNADDRYTQGALDKVACFFIGNPEYKWLTGFCNIVDREGNIDLSREFITKYKNKRLLSYTYTKLLTENNFISQPSTFWRKSLHDEIGYFNTGLNYSFDYDFWCRIGVKYPLGLIEDYLSDFRFYDESKTGSGAFSHINEHFSITKKYTSNPLLLIKSRFQDYKKVFGNYLLKIVKR